LKRRALQKRRNNFDQQGVEIARLKLCRPMLTAVALSFGVPAYAAPIPLVNAGFEDPALPATPLHPGQTYTQLNGGSSFAGWTFDTFGGPGGVFNPANFGAFGYPIGAGYIAGVTGNQVGWLDDGAYFTQTLSQTLEAGVYTLTADVGFRADRGAPGYTIELLLGGNPISGKTGTPTALNAWQEDSLVFTSLFASSETIGIRLVNRTGGGQQVSFDNVRLDFVAASTGASPVPVPAPMAMLGLGLLAMAGSKRVKRS
jgi:hypothetical protein